MSTELIMKIIKMVVACAVWAVAFIILSYTTKKIGMKGNPSKESKKKLDKCKKRAESFLETVTDDKPDKEKKLVKCVRRLKFLLRSASRVFAVVVFDNPDIKEYKNVLDSYHAMFDECKKISSEIATSQYEKIEDHLRNLLQRIDETDNLLDISLAKESEENILNA